MPSPSRSLQRDTSSIWPEGRTPSPVPPETIPLLIPTPTKKLSLKDYAVVSAALIFVEVVHGAYPVIAKLAFKNGTHRVHPIMFVFMRALISTPLLFSLSRYIEKPATTSTVTQTLFPKTWKDITTCLVLGATGISGNQLANAAGVLWTRPFYVSVWQQLIPILTTLIAAALGIESLNPLTRFGGLKWVAILSAAGGALCLVLIELKPSTCPTRSNTFTDNNNMTFALGNIMLFLNCTFFATYIHLSAPLRQQGHPAVRLSAWAHMGGIFWNILIVILALSTRLVSLVDLIPPLQTSSWIPYLLAVSPAVLYASVLSSATAYTLITWASGRVSPPVVAVFVPLQSVTAAVLEGFGGCRGVAGGSVGAAGVVVVGVTGLVWVRWREERCEGEEVDVGERRGLLTDERGEGGDGV
ncbi:hypothetical protein BC829DRAFT_439749 [Chytridium lagenaria]|nr:hypothetical protein BC829DRAFT_439749 [Chytridium lagenaria]